MRTLTDRIVLSAAELTALFPGEVRPLLPLPAPRLTELGWEAVVQSLRARGIVRGAEHDLRIAEEIAPILGLFGAGGTALLIERADDDGIAAAGFVVDGPSAAAVDITAFRRYAISFVDPASIASLVRQAVALPAATTPSIDWAPVDATEWAAVGRGASPETLPAGLVTAYRERPRRCALALVVRADDGTVMTRRLEVHGHRGVWVTDERSDGTAPLACQPEDAGALLAGLVASSIPAAGATA